MDELALPDGLDWSGLLKAVLALLLAPTMYGRLHILALKRTVFHSGRADALACFCHLSCCIRARATSLDAFDPSAGLVHGVGG